MYTYNLHAHKHTDIPTITLPSPSPYPYPCHHHYPLSPPLVIIVPALPPVTTPPLVIVVPAPCTTPTVPHPTTPSHHTITPHHTPPHHTPPHATIASGVICLGWLSFAEVIDMLNLLFCYGQVCYQHHRPTITRPSSICTLTYPLNITTHSGHGIIRTLAYPLLLTLALPLPPSQHNHSLIHTSPAIYLLPPPPYLLTTIAPSIHLLLSQAIEFFACLWLRWAHPDMHRPYTVPIR